jgi:aminoglycoside phosphotransferase (APT) family kinase protein
MSQIEVGALQARLRSVEVIDVRPLTGGASSLTFVGSMQGNAVVVKVAPPGVRPTLHRDVLRQARVLRALGSSNLPVPEVLVEDAGDPPEVPPLFVMSFLEGTSIEPLFDVDDRGIEPSVMAQRMRNAATTMAQLHRISPTREGLAGEAVVGLSEEIERWSRLLETIDPALVPGWEVVREALAASIPSARRPAVVHGDFRLGNLLAVGEEINAVIDWEIWSVGDPRVDVGWFLLNADPATYGRPTRYAGHTPSISELTDIYTGALGENVPDLRWFKALASFKSAATWSLIIKHNRRLPSPDLKLESMTADLSRLLHTARALLV